MNSVIQGVGASQVREYVSRLPQRGHTVSLLSFEMASRSNMELPGVRWTPRPFGNRGALSAGRRIGQAVATARRSRSAIVHARSDLPALATMLAGVDRWVWDMRAFWREQRVALGALSEGSPIAAAMQRVEEQAAARSSAIVCLAESAVPIMQARFGADIVDKITVIPTAVDTDRFTPPLRRNSGPVSLLLSGSFNAFYDGEVMARFVEGMGSTTDTRVVWAGDATSSPSYPRLAPLVDGFIPTVAFDDMPAVVQASDVGVVICRRDGGAALGGAMPTKIAEFLACGRAVVVNPGLGDMDRLLADYRCGVAIEGGSELDVAAAVGKLLELLGDPELAERCRACATEWFDLERSVDRLSGVYEELARR